MRSANQKDKNDVIRENTDNLKNQSFATAGHSGPFIHLFIFLYGVNTGINNYVVILVFFSVTIKNRICLDFFDYQRFEISLFNLLKSPQNYHQDQRQEEYEFHNEFQVLIKYIKYV